MMRISEAAAACGLTIDTIRYYEKSEMLPRIRRSADGRRVFSSTDIEWLTLLYWLRETGMPLKQMRRFTALAKAGSETVPERRDILLQHAAELHHRQPLLKKCQSVLAIKIASYDSSHRSVEA
ncbi:MAG: MerR family transcriptional regulator [Pseudomonadota bacterium]